jgi:hypothetical protein
MTNDAWVGAVNRYAERLHAHAGEDHHVVSALGAWMLVALCSPLTDGSARSELAEVLGVDPAEAERFAAELLSEPHPRVHAGAGMWIAPAFETPAVEDWRAGLPPAVSTGAIPTQEALDAWTAEHTLGLIERFPLDVSTIYFLMATVLATKVSWEVPFDVVDADELAPSPWANDLQWVLRSPRDPRHRQYIAETDRAGQVGVHLARARGGLLVGSVIASDKAVPAADVLASAAAIVSAEARAPRSVATCSLFDLALGEHEAWTISESREGSESIDSILPGWSADTKIDLDHQNLGFPVVARAIKKVIGSVDPYEASQSALARYSAVGFEAAAITHLAVATSLRLGPPGPKRQATLRFGHPYAVVAAAHDDHLTKDVPSCWDGLPVFSAWISEPNEAEPHLD